MKPVWKITLIVLTVLILGLILIWPMAPVWQRMGLEPFCIQGSFPNLQLVECPQQAAEAITPFALPTPGAGDRIPIILDDDSSPDGMVALLYLLNNPMVDVKAVTISYGEAHPERFAPHVAQILTALGRADIPVGYGRDAPLEGSNAFPDAWREASDAFWDIELPQATGMTIPVPAAELIARTVSESDKPVTLFVSGSHTNLAEALRLDPSMADNIGDVYIMGGSVNAPGNIHSDDPEFDNEVAEWNIWVDPLAASEVFSSGLPLHLVPLDATNQVTWEQADLRNWQAEDVPESALAAELVQMTMNAFSLKNAFVWDLVTAVQGTFPEVCPETKLGLQVVTAPGAQQGRTQTVDGPANVSVCLDPDPAKVKAAVMSVFQQP